MPSERPRDYAYEALSAVSGTDMNTGRGALNSALKSIRDETEEQDDYLLADMIYKRAEMYRELMPDAMLTPTALAKHWKRVLEESSRKRTPQRALNQMIQVECRSCDGDRFVLVELRPSVQSQWARERGIKHRESRMDEVMAACPDCNPADTSFRRFDGTLARALDPAKVRAFMGS